MEQVIKYSGADLDNVKKILDIPGDHLHAREVLLQDRDIRLCNVVFSDGAMVEMKVVIPYSRDYPYIQAQFYTADHVPTDMEIRGLTKKCYPQKDLRITFTILSSNSKKEGVSLCIIR